ncbi:GntR family transcriptional regulator [Paenibacillus oralis]|uniref:GntR family transcriptional regulator n=1 Tax=Paenibacillus oralis TaxID=2490856 RepID=A0A3P3TWD8_9BACL|nr:GntR family transcriptional regulator [Paenibacillus oralis]RRJ61699.1 GntR family transcriptional regulator [Paenibacillus oralis]
MNKKEFVINDLLSKIYQNYFPDWKLPTERELAAQYNVSRYTIQESIKKLKDMGMVNVIQGSGIFLNKNLQTSPLIYNSLTENPYSSIKSKVIELQKQSASPEDQQIFGITGKDEVWVYHRLRIVNYRTMQIEISRLPVALFPTLTHQDAEQSIQSYVLKHKYTISHYLNTYEAIALNKEQAMLLQQKRKSPAMKISSRGILSNGKIFETSEIVAIDYKCTYFTAFNNEHHKRRTQ